MRLTHGFLILCVVALTTPATAQNSSDSSRSFQVTLSGIVLMNGYYSDDTVWEQTAPWLVLPRSPLATDPVGAAGATVRNTRIQMAVSSRSVLGGTFEAELDVDFFGEVNGAASREAHPRIRRAVGTVRWPNGWLLFGQETQLISPINPSSLSMVGVPGFTGAGNLSRWMPQVRFGVEAGNALKLGLEGAVVAPQFDHMLANSEASPDRAERSRRPFFQGRVLTRWGNENVGGELGIGGHYGWFFDPTDTLTVTLAGAVSAQVSLARFLEIRGEAYLGEGLGMLGGGGIDQTLERSGNPLATRGGWAQLILKPGSRVEMGAAYGMDDPDDNDVDPVSGREKNVSWTTHVHVRVAPMVFGIEYRRLETTYADAVFDLQTANHVNLAIGFEF